ncbi:putative Tyrosinase copper-binding domain-containing protein [Seiridium unicorne]|uniref:Tyrosinase copper-binding domain-containing protein n=1 Tax=Seiridium unicorne TaxID=138068 RepID=A0ABR2UF02_9PEZI
MRPSRASKAVFIMVDHILAEHLPLFIALTKTYGRGRPIYNAGLSPRQDLITEDIPSINIWAYRTGATASKTAPKPRSKTRRIAKNVLHVSTAKSLIRIKRSVSKTTDKRFEEKKININNRRNQVVKERKNRNFDKTKDKLQKQYNDKDPMRRRKKNRRMSRCAALVPLSMGGLFASEVDELFDEEWAESDEMMAFWPPEVTVKQVDEWVEDQDDSFPEREDYFHKWMEAETKDRDRAIVISARKAVHHVNVPQKFIRDYSGESLMATTTDLVARSPHPATALSTHVDKRCPPCLVPIFAAILRAISVVAQMDTRVGLRLVGKYYKEGSALPLVSAESCTQPAERREWRTLLDSERENYVGAVKCLTTKPSKLGLATSLYEDFPWIHARLNLYVHFVASFLPWHRWFVHLYESALRDECDYVGPMPYWDWTQDSGALPSAPVFSDSPKGFGGPGLSSGFSSPARPNPLTSEERPHCLNRQFNNGTGSEPTDPFWQATLYSPATVANITDNSTTFEVFWKALENTPHGAIHNVIGGDMVPSTSPNGKNQYII